MSTFGNNITIRNCILDGGSQDQWTVQAALATDTSSVIANSLIISHAPIGVAMKYPGFVLHSTIVNADHVPGSVGVKTIAKWVFNDSTVANTAIFGFAHGVAHGKNTSWSPKSSHNATDAPSDDAGTGPWPYGESKTSIVDVLPGTSYNVSPNTVFMNFGRDWRLSPNSPLRATGDAFGSFSVNCSSIEPNCLQRTTYSLDTPDMIGTPRPQAGRYDIGAWQSCAFAALGSGSRC